MRFPPVVERLQIKYFNLLYECLTGAPPFPGDTMPQLVAAHLSTPPPLPSTTRPNVPAQVDEVIATGMAKDPNQRYATAIELADAARDAITVPIARPKPTSTQPPTEPAAKSLTLPATEEAQSQSPVTAEPTVTAQSLTLANSAPPPTPPTIVDRAPNTSAASKPEPAGLLESAESEQVEVYELESPYAPTRALWAGIIAGVVLIAIVVIMVLAFVGINHGP
jgi:serine/threonine protein kinase